MASADEFAAMFYGESGVLGLLANGISAFLVLLQNFNGAQTGVPSQGVEHILADVQLILIGGVTQLLARLLSFRKYDHLSGTSFIAFAALWGSYGSTRIVLGAFPPSINSTNTTDQLYPANSTFLNTELAPPPIGQSAIAGLIAYISISFILSFCSATVNYIMPFVFGAITLTLIFEAVGLVGGWALVVSGVLELVILICGLYGAAALLLKVLLSLTLVMEVIVVCFLLSTLGRLPYQLEIAMLAIFSLICLYGTLASLANSIFTKELLPLRPPLLKATQEKADKTPPPPPCSIATSRKTSGLLSISKLLDAGGVCGVPTDTVYALAASCKHPQAIEKIYNIKDRPQEKPICICISNLEQLSTAKPPFSPLLWEFMRNVYPGGISCIVKKGEWLNKLGVGPAYDRVGTKESIMIRVPDHTVTAHLCNMTGPLAITSANPSGELDSTHHDMVITRLGHKISGVLCDGESNEAVGSTVVNCLKIDEEITQGQFVNQSESSVTVKEKENATLPCSYKDPPTDFYMFWYIQTGSQAPCAIYSELVGDSNLPSKLQNRLSASHDKTGKTFHLIISSVDLSDSSVYFCALQPTARESAPSAIQ
ncbi:UNVERIFIED_CONTAM: hypothetical protein FKN15_015499 [Acipenser sinensis]